MRGLSADVPFRGGQEPSLSACCKPHRNGVKAIACEQRRQRLFVSGGCDGGLALFDLGPTDQPQVKALEPVVLVAPSTPSIIDLEESFHAGHEGKIEDLAWLPSDDKLLVSGGVDKCMKIWDVARLDEGCVLTLKLGSTIHSLSFSPGRSMPLVAAALADNTLRLVDLRTGRAVQTLEGHTKAVRCTTWGTIQSCGTKTEIKIECGVKRENTSTHTFQDNLVSGGDDGTVRVWDTRMGRASLFLCDPYGNEPGPSKKPKRTDVDDESGRPDDGFLARRNKIQLISVLDGKEGLIEPPRIKSVYRLLSNNYGNCGSMMRLPGTGGHMTNSQDTLPKGCDPAEEMSKDTRTAAQRVEGYLEPPRREYDCESSIAHRGGVAALGFVERREGSSIEQRLLSCGCDGKIRFWDPTNGKPAAGSKDINYLAPPSGCGLQIDADSSQEDVLLTPEVNYVGVICLRTGKALCRLAAHTDQVNCVCYLRYRGEVLSGSSDGRLLRWWVGHSRKQSTPVICLD